MVLSLWGFFVFLLRSGYIHGEGSQNMCVLVTISHIPETASHLNAKVPS